MKSLLACVLFVFAATAMAAAAPAPSGARAHCKVAPADEYFGKLKMSILGIRNVIRDQGAKVDYYPENAPATLGTMALTEDALHDWQRKYPCDSWLPGSIYALEHFYTKFHTADGATHVHAIFAWLRHDFPRSSFAAAGSQEDTAAMIVAPLAAAAAAGPP